FFCGPTNQGQGARLISGTKVAPAVTVLEQPSGVYVRKYNFVPDDVEWACTGVVATILNGEAVPLVQNRITDAGFKDLVVIHLGADKVLIRCSASVDVVSIVNNAKEFFGLFL
ncbi:DUF4283 domain protein, partial [Trifolium medium]|nr:DUF4283 domain protein [Trifolium medium]